MFAGLASVTPGGAPFVGLWYPIVVAVMSLIIGGIWIRETKDIRIWDEVGGDNVAEERAAVAEGGNLSG